MIPEDCRQCWDPECIRRRMSGEAIDWGDFGEPGQNCQFFVPVVDALEPCHCCGQDMAMLDIMDSGGFFVWCQNCGTATRTYDNVEGAIRSWNTGEVCEK